MIPKYPCTNCPRNDACSEICVKWQKWFSYWWNEIKNLFADYLAK